MKYKTYKELKDAYDKGELSRDEHILQLDNDENFLYVGDVCVFRGDGYRDIDKLMELAGIPAEWV